MFLSLSYCPSTLSHIQCCNKKKGETEEPAATVMPPDEFLLRSSIFACYENYIQTNAWILGRRFVMAKVFNLLILNHQLLLSWVKEHRYMKICALPFQFNYLVG